MEETVGVTKGVEWEGAAAAEEASHLHEVELEKRVALLQDLERRRQAVSTVCVRLSEGLARSGCVAPGVTLLCDAGCTSWGFDRLQSSLEQLADNVVHHWGCHQAQLQGAGAQITQLRQQLATTQRLLDSYDTRGTAGDARELAAAAAAHGRGPGPCCGRGEFVTYGRSRARPKASTRGVGAPAAAPVTPPAACPAARSRAGRHGIFVGIDYE